MFFAWRRVSPGPSAIFPFRLCPCRWNLNKTIHRDYDGDTIRLIFDESIVKDFNNAPLHFADPTFEMSDYFDSHTETIQKAIGSQAARATAEDALQAEEKRAAKIAGILLAPLFAPAHYGQLANYHLRQIYLHSASHPESRLLAQLFAIALDASKQSMQMNLSKFDSLSRKLWYRVGNLKKDRLVFSFGIQASKDLHQDGRASWSVKTRLRKTSR